MRIWTISDIHIDFLKNAEWVTGISEMEFRHDVLILAGDVSHQFELLTQTLVQLKKKFARVFFAPGNHDLWIRGEDWPNSLTKFNAILNFCRQNQIDVQSSVLMVNGQKICLVPVFSWYDLPPARDSLYLPKPGEDITNRMWSDNYFIRWPEDGFEAVAYFLEQSNPFVLPPDCHQIITFSHFLPRAELMFSGAMMYDLQRMKRYDRAPKFNFSRVAGSTKIEKFIRHLGASVHIYGHQHINRDRVIDGVRYISHCLGYPDERKRGTVQGIEQGLKRVL